jgi:hypothetical protein
VASDFVRSLLDLFAYEDRDACALVLAAGVPESWLARPEGVTIRRLGTPWGSLTYRLERRAEEAGGGVRYRLGAVPGGVLEAAPRFDRPLQPPPGGIVFTWPLAGPVGGALVDGRPAVVGRDGRLVVHGVPATVVLLPAADERTER